MNPGLDFTVGDIIEEKEPTKYRKGTTFKVTVIDQQHYAYIIRLQTKGPSSILPGEAYTMQVRHGKAVPVRSSYHTLEFDVDYSIHFDLAHKWKKVGENPGNPGPGNELQFKASLARAEPFMNELRRLRFDVGHDADYEDPTHFMTVIVRDVPAGRKRILLITADRFGALLKSGGNERYKYVRTDDWSRKIYKDTTTGKYYVDVEGELHTMTEVGEPMYSIGVKTPGSNPGNPGEKTVHGYNYKVRIWYPNAPENSTEGMMLAAYDEDLAKEIQRQYPGVTYEIISKEPVLGDPQPQHGGNPQLEWVWQDTGGGSGYWYNTRTTERRWAGKGDKPKGNPGSCFADCFRAMQKIYPGVERERLKHYLSLGDWERRNIVYMYGGISKETHPAAMHNDIDEANRVCEAYNPGNPGPGVDGNLRDRLIAEIYNNRMNAWKQGHVGIKPVSDDDLTELRSMTTEELEQTAKLTRQFLIPMVGQAQVNPRRKWAPSQVWAACKQAGVPVDERDVIVKHYLETGELPFQTWPSLRLIESWPEQPGE